MENNVVSEYLLGIEIDGVKQGVVSSMLRARRRERVRTARWIRMVMVEASFMKCGSQASSMEEILLLLLHRNRSPFL